MHHPLVALLIVLRSSPSPLLTLTPWNSAEATIPSMISLVHSSSAIKLFLSRTRGLNELTRLGPIHTLAKLPPLFSRSEK